MKNIDILTYASGYSYNVFERFCGSLNDTGFNGKIYIIIKPNDMEKINLLKQKYSNVYELIDNLEIKTAIHNHRFFVKKHYLDLGIFKSDLLLLCDFRDVLFQKNIENYDFDNNTDLYFFLEGINFTQDYNCNTPWLKRLETIFQESFYNEICYNKVICSGTTIGTLNGLSNYLNILCGILTKYKINEVLDQGIHNYMIYRNKILDVNIKLLSNEENLVNTVGCDVKILNENNLIINKNKDVSFVVHQYDRFTKELKEKISSKYNFVE
jgi:hypothetical protein